MKQLNARTKTGIVAVAAILLLVIVSQSAIGFGAKSEVVEEGGAFMAGNDFLDAKKMLDAGVPGVITVARVGVASSLSVARGDSTSVGYTVTYVAYNETALPQVKVLTDPQGAGLEVGKMVDTPTGKAELSLNSMASYDVPSFTLKSGESRIITLSIKASSVIVSLPLQAVGISATYPTAQGIGIIPIVYLDQSEATLNVN
jgi:hypothetical protein